ncbi:MAG: lipoate--protein ligase family protein [Actinobacteria bacterium]|nr:lipoate--protein ligase family protein [Actinomycetota bacterium]MCG2806920.1 lipoate--protein ligase family protein [Coriobacteriia bacterium]
MTPQWRLIVDDTPASGAWNMALDRAIQLSHAERGAPPTLRLYSWDNPTVTLGRFQDVGSVDMDACDRFGVDVVRRFTGGRGVLHDDELTYSIVAGVRDGVPRGVATSYRHLCSGLVQAYKQLGVPAELTSRPRGDASSAACYLHATHADLSVGVAKLSGSAQVWAGESVLQHGSFTRTRDLARETAVFALDASDLAKLAASTATLSEYLPEPPSLIAITRAAAQGFAEALGVEFIAGPLTAEEILLADELFEQVLLEVHR